VDALDAALDIALRKFLSLPLAGTISIFSQPGDETSPYAQDFLDLINEVPPHNQNLGLDWGTDRVQHGIQLRFSETDMKEDTVPPRCSGLVKVLRDQLHIDVVTSTGNPAPGYCWLMVGPK
jgi:hypothetical protein